ncbi:MAG: hypothetical protein ACYCOR_13765 [Acidobacteriaceae bacterium]
MNTIEDGQMLADESMTLQQLADWLLELHYSIRGRRLVSRKHIDAVHAAIAELEKCREDAERLVPHAKWLRECGLELAHDGHYGWANTLTMAADAIDAARSKP